MKYAFKFAKSFLLSWILTTVMNKVLEGRDLVPSKIWIKNENFTPALLTLFRWWNKYIFSMENWEPEEKNVKTTELMCLRRFFEKTMSLKYLCCTSFVSATSASISEMLYALVTHVSLWRLSQISYRRARQVQEVLKFMKTYFSLSKTGFISHFQIG